MKPGIRNGMLAHWWSVLEACAASLTAPRPDIERADRDVAGVLALSVLGRAALSVGAIVTRAWAGSTVRALAVTVARPGASHPAASLRTAAIVVFVGGASALVLQALLSTIDPLTWVLPIVAAVSALVVFCGADPLARAWNQRRVSR